MELGIGSTHRCLLSSFYPYKIHIIGVVDDDYIVYKWYGRHKQWWHYEVDHRDSITIRIKYAEGRPRYTSQVFNPQ